MQLHEEQTLSPLLEFSLIHHTLIHHGTKLQSSRHSPGVPRRCLPTPHGAQSHCARYIWIRGVAQDRARNRTLLSTQTSHSFSIDIRDINFEQLHKAGVVAIAFDKDNCLTRPYGKELYPPFNVM
jgi:hypothetical protein